MKKTLKFKWWVPVIAIACAGACDNELGEKIPDDYFQDQTETLTPPYIFQKGYEDYSCYRIPALVQAKDGTLLAFAEARKNDCGDDGDIDMVLKRSTDGGKSRSEMAVLWDDGENTCGNPAPVVDDVTGEVHLLMCLNNDRVFVTSSSDHGTTWSTPGYYLFRQERRVDWYATGPVHGIQIKNGPYAGRLVVACDHTGDAHTIYSDDHGATWKLGGITSHAVYSPNESSVAELSNGQLMLNMRCPNSDNRRLVSLSEDGGESWSTPQSHDQLIDPVCQGSLFSAVSSSGQHQLFFANPAHETRRRNMTLRMSTDNGATFSKSHVVYSEFAAYSDMTILDDNSMAMLYERGASDANEGIAFEIISLSNLK